MRFQTDKVKFSTKPSRIQDFDRDGLMRLGIFLEPAGPEAARVMRGWLEASALAAGADNLVEVDPDKCFDLLTTLRDRCYGRGLTVNVTFHGKDD